MLIILLLGWCMLVLVARLVIRGMLLKLRLRIASVRVIQTLFNMVMVSIIGNKSSWSMLYFRLLVVMHMTAVVRNQSSWKVSIHWSAMRLLIETVSISVGIIIFSMGINIAHLSITQSTRKHHLLLSASVVVSRIVEVLQAWCR